MHWPYTASQRQQLAVVLTTHNPVQDPVIFAEKCSNGFSISFENGLCRIDQVAVVQQSIVSNGHKQDEDKHKQILPNQLCMLALHVLWLGFKGQAPIIASFLQAKNKTSPFWHSMYSYTAWILTPPAEIYSAMCIGRPDLQVLAMSYYMMWLKRVRNPALVVEALQVLRDTPLLFNSWTPLWQRTKQWFDSAGVQAASVFKQANLLTCSKRSKPSLCINNSAKVFLAECDYVYLIMRLLWDPNVGFAGRGALPDDAPPAFAVLKEDQPYLFDFSLSVPTVPFDELLVITTPDTTNSDKL